MKGWLSCDLCKELFPHRLGFSVVESMLALQTCLCALLLTFHAADKSSIIDVLRACSNVGAFLRQICREHEVKETCRKHKCGRTFKQKDSETFWLTLYHGLTLLFDKNMPFLLLNKKNIFLIKCSTLKLAWTQLLCTV